MLQLDIGKKHWKSECVFINMWLVRDAAGENRVWKYIQGKEKSVTIFKKYKNWEFPCGPAVAPPRAWVRSLVGELRSNKLCSTAKKQTKTERF